MIFARFGSYEITRIVSFIVSRAKKREIFVELFEIPSGDTVPDFTFRFLLRSMIINQAIE